MNTDNKYLSRSFWITLYGMTGTFVMAWLLEDATIVTVVIPVLVTNWFGGKLANAIVNKDKPA